MQSWQRRKIKECASNPIRSQWWTEAQSLGRATFPTRFSRPSPPFFPSPRLPPVRPPKLTTSRENSSRQKRSALLGKVTLGSKKWCQPKCNSFCILNSLRTHSIDKSYLKKKAHQSLKHLVMAHGLCDVEPDGATTTTADRQWQLQQELHGSLEDYQ